MFCRFPLTLFSGFGIDITWIYQIIPPPPSWKTVPCFHEGGELFGQPKKLFWGKIPKYFFFPNFFPQKYFAFFFNFFPKTLFFTTLNFLGEILLFSFHFFFSFFFKLTFKKFYLSFYCFFSNFSKWKIKNKNEKKEEFPKKHSPFWAYLFHLPPPPPRPRLKRPKPLRKLFEKLKFLDKNVIRVLQGNRPS